MIRIGEQKNDMQNSDKEFVHRFARDDDGIGARHLETESYF